MFISICIWCNTCVLYIFLSKVVTATTHRCWGWRWRNFRRKHSIYFTISWVIVRYLKKKERSDNFYYRHFSFFDKNEKKKELWNKSASVFCWWQNWNSNALIVRVKCEQMEKTETIYMKLHWNWTKIFLLFFSVSRFRYDSEAQTYYSGSFHSEQQIAFRWFVENRFFWIRCGWMDFDSIFFFWSSLLIKLHTMRYFLSIIFFVYQFFIIFSLVLGFGACIFYD